MSENITVSHVLPKTRFLELHFCCSLGLLSTTLAQLPSLKLPNSVK